MIPIKLRAGIELSRVGAVFPIGLDRQEWRAVWKELEGIDASINWVMGDALNFAKAAYGEKYAAAVNLTRWSYERLKDVASVCARVPMSLRNDNLDYSHHVVVASLAKWQPQVNEEDAPERTPESLEAQRRYLAEAEANKWTVSELRVAIRRSSATRTRSSARGIGFVPRCWVSEGMRHLRREALEDWPADRRAALAQDLRPIADLYSWLNNADAPPP